MGYHDTDWATGLDLPQMQKVVLVALAIRTDDDTHDTLVGQETIAAMMSISVASVRRALADLERASIIRRDRRHGQGGYRTSDRTTLNTAYQSDSPQGSQPTRHTAHKADSPHLPITQVAPTDHSDRAIDQPDNQPEDQPDTRARGVFDDFYAAWPRKRSRRDAERAWQRCLARGADPNEIVAAACRYRDGPNRPDDRFIPYPASWLDADGWADEPEPPPRPIRADTVVTIQPGTRCAPGQHQLARDGSCLRCELRPGEAA